MIPSPTATDPTTLITTATATSTPIPGTDTVTILSATEDRGQGVTRYLVEALSSHTTDPLPILIMTGTGINPLGQSPMTSLGNGNYVLEVTLKRRLDTLTVTSSHGGQTTVVF